MWHSPGAQCVGQGRVDTSGPPIHGGATRIWTWSPYHLWRVRCTRWKPYYSEGRTSLYTRGTLLCTGYLIVYGKVPYILKWYLTIKDRYFTIQEGYLTTEERYLTTEEREVPRCAEEKVVDYVGVVESLYTERYPIIEWGDNRIYGEGPSYMVGRQEITEISL